MNLPSVALQKAYYLALNGEISVYSAFIRKVADDGGTNVDTTHTQSVVNDLASFLNRCTIFSPCTSYKTGKLYASAGSSLLGITTPVFDVVPPDTDYPYVHLAGMNVVESNFNIDKRITDIIMDVDVVTGYDGSFGGKKQAFEISEQLINIIRQSPGSYLSLQGFTMLTATLDSAFVREEQNDTHTLFINRLRFRHKIQEN